jgi:hypothetical protein
MSSSVEIKPGPPWESAPPAAEDQSDPTTVGRFDLHNPEDRKLRSQLRWSALFLVVVFAGFAFSIVLNFAQAARTGGGSGFGDTKLLPLKEGKAFFETHNVPDSNH